MRRAMRSGIRPASISRPATPPTSPVRRPHLPDLLKHVHALLADKAYDAQARVIARLEQAAVTVVIPQKPIGSSLARMTNTSIKRAI